MRQTSQLLCVVEQRHSYFQDPLTPAVRITPTAATVRNLQRAGLWVKPTANGLAVLRDLNDAAAARPLPDFLFPLRFQLEPLSPYFANFTVLPPPKPQPAHGRRAIHYFHVRAAKGPLVKLKAEKALLLPLTPFTLTADTGQLPAARPAVRVLAVAQGTTVATALPLDKNDQVILDETGQVAVDVRRGGGGRYQLRVAGTRHLDFYADEQLYAAQTWGILEISQTALLAPPLTVQLAFTARSTYWCYQLRYRVPAEKLWQQPARELSVTATARPDTKLPAVDFERLLPPPAGAGAAFISTHAIPLRERPDYACALRCTQPALLVALLPTPGAEVVRPLPADWPRAAADTEAQSAYSEILVHL
ncbi:hypothetical protein [Hymenobacter perfusus]|uniref:Uncharacterized protein n=1 Tax=Hymenobacter perfusus TaxID=1236770 RepID=A0A428KAP4_9BACT|nr:hypothetical protein [Hymenobacter perfusus]RSK43451.1 hypothetical protein EI293_11185 [Hymenobacter perfusus]